MTRPADLRPCSIRDCSGTYEERRVDHTVRYHGEIRVIENVPAEVCSVCGDVLLSPETVRRIEEILQERSRPVVRHAPVYQYA